MHDLLGHATLVSLAAPDDAPDSRRLGAQAGYGFGAFGDRFTATPELGLALVPERREYRLGWRLALALAGGGPTAFELALEGTLRPRVHRHRRGTRHRVAHDRRPADRHPGAIYIAGGLFASARPDTLRTVARGGRPVAVHRDPNPPPEPFTHRPLIVATRRRAPSNQRATSAVGDGDYGMLPASSMAR